MTEPREDTGSTPLAAPGRSYSTLAVAANVLAFALYQFGLIAPLTPSHGLPSLWALLVFAGGPAALLWAATRLWRDARYFFYAEILLIAAFTCYLLLFVERPFR